MCSPRGEEFHLRQLDRATVLPLAEDQVPCLVTTAEDILLAKLRWYADGGRISERQWNDICGLIAINASMDWAYIEKWAVRLSVADLLAKARVDARR